MVVDQVHVHGLAVLEAEHHASIAGYANAPLARAITLQRMQPEARSVGTARMRCLLQAEQDAPKPWHQTAGQPRGIVALV